MSYWKTIITDNLRVYFPVKSGGNLVSSLSSSFFTSSIINPTDNNSLTTSVSQSTQKSGIYYTDITSSFFINNGVGMYGLSVGVHKPAPNRIDDETLFSIEVTEGDLSTLISQTNELHLIHGLNPLYPLTVNTAERTSENITQSINYDSGSNETIVTRI